METDRQQLIGFIGQGWIGKNFADDFERRGYSTVRYALEEPYVQNKDKIKSCNLVYIAVPTPTTVDGFTCEPVIDALTLLSEGSTAVIKSTILPGTTKRLQGLFPHLYVLHSPEFLMERTVKKNVEEPERNIIGIPEKTEEFQKRAENAMSTLPRAPFEKVMCSTNAELIKYANNTALMSKVLFMNILYDFVESCDGEWDTVREGLIADSRIGDSHTQPVFEGGRGAGGHCFIKDFEAFRQHYNSVTSNKIGSEVLKAMTLQNNDLLCKSNKSLDILTDTFELKIKD